MRFNFRGDVCVVKGEGKSLVPIACPLTSIFLETDINHSAVEDNGDQNFRMRYFHVFNVHLKYS